VNRLRKPRCFGKMKVAKRFPIEPIEDKCLTCEYLEDCKDMTALRMINEYVEKKAKELADEKIKGIVKFEEN
jgi:hypothetical protein